VHVDDVASNSQRNRVPFNSVIEDLKCMSMTWRATIARPYSQVVQASYIEMSWGSTPDPTVGRRPKWAQNIRRRRLTQKTRVGKCAEGRLEHVLPDSTSVVVRARSDDWKHQARACHRM
jgi:hypothetical protein